MTFTPIGPSWPGQTIRLGSKSWRPSQRRTPATRLANFHLCGHGDERRRSLMDSQNERATSFGSAQVGLFTQWAAEPMGSHLSTQTDTLVTGIVFTQTERWDTRPPLARIGCPKTQSWWRRFCSNTTQTSSWRQTGPLWVAVVADSGLVTGRAHHLFISVLFFGFLQV